MRGGVCGLIVGLLQRFPGRESHTKACELVRNLARDEVTHEALSTPPAGESRSVWDALASGASYDHNSSYREAWLSFFCMTVNLAIHYPVAVHASEVVLAGGSTTLELILAVLRHPSNLDDAELQAEGMSCLATIAFDLPRVQENLMGANMGAVDHIVAMMASPPL